VKPLTQSSIFLADCLSRPAEQAPRKPTFMSFIHQFSQEGDADDEDHWWDVSCWWSGAFSWFSVLRGYFLGSHVDDERSGCKNLVMGLFVSLGLAVFFASEIIFLVMYPLPIVGC
jgi:hypothetical protein